MARHVGPRGHVYSTDINPQRLQDIRNAVGKADLQNVTVVDFPPDDGVSAPAGRRASDASHGVTPATVIEELKATGFIEFNSSSGRRVELSWS